MKFILTVLILWVVLLSACQQNDICLTPTNVYCRGSLARKITADSLVDSSLINANIVFEGKDSTYLYNMKKSGKFLLTPSSTADSMSFYFESDSTTSAPQTIDTVQLFYSRKLKFISVACGFQTEFTIQSVKHSKQVLDSIQVMNTEVNSEANNVHLKFILKDS
jgi:hypothetical protein